MCLAAFYSSVRVIGFMVVKSTISAKIVAVPLPDFHTQSVPRDIILQGNSTPSNDVETT